MVFRIDRIFGRKKTKYFHTLAVCLYGKNSDKKTAKTYKYDCKIDNIKELLQYFIFGEHSARPV